jgi:S-adenosylmethionine uptake transporter
MLLIAPFAVAVWSPPSTGQLGWFALIGLLGTGGHVALAWAYRHADASRLGAIEYTAFLWAVALGLVFFGEVPSLATLAGAALIIVGAFLAVRAQQVGAPGA